MSVVWAVLAGLGFFALILLSIALHEVGHLVPAKLFGVRVPQYFVGFGKTLWSRQVGETEYGVKLVPLGGYVRLLGMYPPSSKRRTGRLAELAEDAREAEAVDITATDRADSRLFYQKKTWQKLVVMFGGPFMNLLLAFGMFWGVNGLYGVAQSTLQIAVVSDCLDPAPAACVAPPAKAAGLQANDTVVAVNGTTVTTWSQLVQIVRANGAAAVQITVHRPGQGRVDLPAVPGVVRDVASLDDPNATVKAGFLGVSPTRAMVKLGPAETLADMWSMTKASVGALVQFPVKVFGVAADLVTGKPRDVNGPISVVGASVAAGELATAGQLDPGARAATFVMLLGAVNLFVALFNLVPLPPLDGGHIAGALYEGLRRAAAKVFKRPDPGYVDTARMLPVAYLVGGFLLLAGVIVIIADVISPVRIF